MPQFKLLLKELRKNTAANHPDYANVVKAEELVREFRCKRSQHARLQHARSQHDHSQHPLSVNDDFFYTTLTVTQIPSA